MSKALVATGAAGIFWLLPGKPISAADPSEHIAVWPQFVFYIASDNGASGGAGIEGWPSFRELQPQDLDGLGGQEYFKIIQPDGPGPRAARFSG